jgi:hypothetical protein
MADFGIGEAAAATAATTAAGTAAAAAPVAAGVLGTGLTVSQMAALASLAATVSGFGMSVYDRANQPGAQGIPKPPSFNPSVATTPTGATLPPGERSNVRPAGTSPPQFFANMTDDPTGGRMGVLEQIRSSMTA